MSIIIIIIEDQGEYPELQSNYEDEGQEETPTQNQLQDVMTENEAISENDVVIQTHYQNNWDGDLRVVCPKGSALYRFQSIHSNYREDRRWRFDCKKVSWHAVTMLGALDPWTWVQGNEGI